MERIALFKCLYGSTVGNASVQGVPQSYFRNFEVILLGLSINRNKHKPYIQSKKRFVSLCVSCFRKSILKSPPAKIDLLRVTSVNKCSMFLRNVSISDHDVL